MTTDNRMFALSINPRFCDTDAMGHINNTVYPVWFLEGRESILKIFNPSLSTEEVSLVLAKLEIEYIDEIFFGKTVEIRTVVLRVGTSSVLVGQEAWQSDSLCATATATMVNFDKHTRKSVQIIFKSSSVPDPHACCFVIGSKCKQPSHRRWRFVFPVFLRDIARSGNLLLIYFFLAMKVHDRCAQPLSDCWLCNNDRESKESTPVGIFFLFVRFRKL